MSEIIRKLASVQRIVEIASIPGADKICAYRVEGWWVVDQVSKYAIGELVIFVEIDSFVPSAVAPFLTKPGHFPKTYEGVEGERLRTIKLRGQLSQGLILPLDRKETNFHAIIGKNGEDIWVEEGEDVTDILGIVKYEPPVAACLAGVAKGNFPSFGRKTDQERIENCAYDVFVANADAEYEITLKMDGSSCSAYFNNGTVGVCSRNLELKIEEDNSANSFIATAKSTGLLDALIAMKKNVMVSGELMGPGIQGNKEKLSSHQLFVFDIFDIDSRKYMGAEERLATITCLRQLGFTGDHVPIIERKVKLADVGIIDVESSKVFVDRPSLNAPTAEGCVFKRVDGDFSFKSINNKFLLKFD